MNRVMTAGPRPALAAGDGRGGRAARRPRARRLLRDGRPCAGVRSCRCWQRRGLDFSPRMIERARRKSDAVAWVEGDALSLPFEDDCLRRDHRRLWSPQRRRSRRCARASSRACSSPEGGSAILEITQPTGASPLLPSVARADRPCSAGRLPAARPTRPPGQRAPISRQGRSRHGDRGSRFRDVAYRTFAGGIVALHTAVST